MMRGSLTVGGLSSMPSFERYMSYFRNDTEDNDSENKLILSDVMPIEKIVFDQVWIRNLQFL